MYKTHFAETFTAMEKYNKSYYDPLEQQLVQSSTTELRTGTNLLQEIDIFV